MIRRTGLGQRPYIAIRGYSGLGAHAVLGMKVTSKRYGEVLCTRDPNIILPALQKESCRNFFYMEDGEVYYKRHERPTVHISRFQHFSDEDKRMKKYLDIRYRSCMVRAFDNGYCRG
jgi:hypothetical protein